jgi:hypothetical protein
MRVIMRPSSTGRNSNVDAADGLNRKAQGKAGRVFGHYAPRKSDREARLPDRGSGG